MNLFSKTPVAHVEAGLRSGDIHHSWAEEVNCMIVGAFAALHFTPTEAAVEVLRRENVDPATIHVTGKTVIDALYWVAAKIATQPGLAGGLAALGRRFAGKRIIGTITHRREEDGDGREAIASAVRQLAARDDVAAILPVHLNPDVRAVLTRRSPD